MFTKAQIRQANKMRKSTMLEVLGIEFFLDPAARIGATMPVNERTKQPFGILHGGATAALAESLGSYASGFHVGMSDHQVLGIEVTANHLRTATSGIVTALAEPVHLGRTIHVWDIRVRNEENELVALCKMTNLIRKTIIDGGGTS